jgi:hypothetical protein
VALVFHGRVTRGFDFRRTPGFLFLEPALFLAALRFLFPERPFLFATAPFLLVLSVLPLMLLARGEHSSAVLDGSTQREGGRLATIDPERLRTGVERQLEIASVIQPVGTRKNPLNFGCVNACHFVRVDVHL